MSDKILILSVAGDPSFGAERLLASFLDALPHGFAQNCVLARPPHSSLARWSREAPVQKFDWPARRDALAHNLAAALVASRILRASGVRLVHAWGARAFEAALLLGRRLSVPVSATLHDHPRANFHGPLRQRLIAMCAPRLRTMVCVSRAVAEACSDAAIRASVIVIRNGAPASPARAARSTDGSTKVGFLGLYAPWKGFGIVLDWIRRAGPEIEWHLYGQPAPEHRIACDTLRAEKRQNVTLHGWVDSMDILDRMDILVHASTKFEPFGMVLVEAARAGIPVVASDLGGPREIVADGETGFLFSPSEPDRGLGYLRALARDPELRRRMGAAARRRFEADFAIDRMVDSYIALWQGHLQECRVGTRC